MVPVILMREKDSGEFVYKPASAHALNVLIDYVGVAWFHACNRDYVAEELSIYGHKLTAKWCHVARVPADERLHHGEWYTCNAA